MKPSKSLSSRLSLYVISAIAGLLLIGLVGIAITSHSAVRKEAIRNATSTLGSICSEINSVLSCVESAVHNSIWVVDEHRDDPDYHYNVTKALVSHNNDISGSAVAFAPDAFPEKGRYWSPYSCRTASGEIRSFQLGNDEYDYFGMEWFDTPATTSGDCWCEPYFDEGGGDRLMTTFSVPVKDESGSVYAVLTADISLTDLTDSISVFHPFAHSYTFILSHSGRFISHPNENYLMNETATSVLGHFNEHDVRRFSSDIQNGKSGSAVFRDFQGNRNYIVYGPLDNGWPVAIVCSYEDVFAGWNKLLLHLLVISLLDLALLFFIARRIIRKTIAPISSLTESAVGFAEGNFNEVVPQVDSEDELRQLRDSMEYMMKSVNNYIEKLRTTTAAKERYESELSIASAIQKQMLRTDFMNGDGVDLHAALVPAKEVGGDMYDYNLHDNTLYLSVGDVSGKGVPAALYMAIARYSFRFVSNLGLGVDGVVSRINNAFSEGNARNMFITMFVASIDLGTMKMSLCNAGHNPAIIISPDGKAELLKTEPNIAAGVVSDFKYSKQVVEIKPGSRLVVYTDGVTEAENAAHEQYGEERLLEFAASQPTDLSSEEFDKRLLESVHKFAAGHPQNDDITMLSVKF